MSIYKFIYVMKTLKVLQTEEFVKKKGEWRTIALNQINL